MLSKYGVVYEEDELEDKRIPTFHRNQKSSIVDAEEYKNAIAYATDEQAAQELEQVQKDSRLFASGIDGGEIEQTLSKTRQAGIDQANREKKSRESILKSAKFIPALIFLAIFGLSRAITAVGCMISQSVSYTAGAIALLGGILAIGLVYSKYLVKRGYKCKNIMIVFIFVQLFGTGLVTMLAGAPVAICAVVAVVLAVLGVGFTVLAVMKNKKYLDLVATIRAEKECDTRIRRTKWDYLVEKKIKKKIILS